MPTILDLAEISHPAKDCKGREMAPYRNRQVFRMTGKSWVEYFSQRSAKVGIDGAREGGGGEGDGHGQGEQGIYGEVSFHGWELHGMASLRRGKWKIVWLGEDVPTGKDAWELFDLDADPGEVSDLAKENPERVKEMMLLFDQ